MTTAGPHTLRRSRVERTVGVPAWWLSLIESVGEGKKNRLYFIVSGLE